MSAVLARVALALVLSLVAASCSDTWDDDDAGPPGQDDDDLADDDATGDDDVVLPADDDDDDATGHPCGNPAWECETPGTTEVCGTGACNDTRECLGDCTWGECSSHCGADETCCASGCADLTVDVNHCGECDRICTYGDTPRCYGGGCCVDSARNGSEICDDQAFTVPSPYQRMFLGCQSDNGGIGFVSTNTGPPMEDGISRCQGWEENGMDAWDHLAYVAQITCDTTGQWLEVDLSMYEGHGLWFGSHDLPQGGGHMTDVCLAEGP